jgi:hypothetical protein
LSAWSSGFTITGQAGNTLPAAGDPGAQTMLLAHSYGLSLRREERI